ncbi:esterase family protein [Paenibacillus oenotherae]|uniref:Esterase family protein n=1 Tax=Paenibacillus oenotherae TaxID=1435645 RepID=A0ABS7DCK9_9BACL|nr:alpha/beta hydrolase-fold protein [Paenibacillus oenotherae]MBW7477585.1 esterase family protein [Paenibacillus oenotherae]
MTDNRYLKRTINKETVPSTHLPEGSRDLRVYLPPGYNELLSYPVVYCQDGEDFFNFGRIATIANRMILDEGLEPFLIVGVEVDKSKRTDEYAADGARHNQYTTFFGEELIPFIEGKYPVRREPSQRVLAGDSLGATVSLHIALAYPDLFHQIISLSGAYYPSSCTIASETGDLGWLTMYMIVGLQETAYETDRGIYDFVAMNREMKQILESKNATLHYSEHEGQHAWGFWQRMIPEALQTFIDSDS